MKIAVVSDDGKTISQHFGRAIYYLVYSIEEGSIVSRERREKWAIAILQANSTTKNIPFTNTARAMLPMISTTR